ncbi:MAG: ComF family protein, partial [Mameliella sp.]|nr:ComF family protein [Phaeodactylibacter sp.]
SRSERQINVGSAFELAPQLDLNGKHILLVDDVVTTGATLEACGIQLLQIENLRLSMAAIAIAD